MYTIVIIHYHAISRAGIEYYMPCYMLNSYDLLPLAWITDVCLNVNCVKRFKLLYLMCIHLVYTVRSYKYKSMC